MTNATFRMAVTMAAAVACLTAGPAFAQGPAAAAKQFRTPWGHPDLQGIWTTWDETPLQAADTPEEAGRVNSAEFEVLQKAPETVEGRLASPSGGGMSQLHSSVVNARRRSLVVEPANGRIPVLPGRATVRRTDQGRQDSWTGHSGWERCFFKGPLGRNIESGGNYDKAYRILQTPTYIVILHEQVHDMRIIPLDGRPHVGPGIRLWHGDARGRFDGNTLVIETTNFNDRGDGYGGGRQTESLKLVERYTRIDDKTLDFEVTVEDPTVFAQPWKARAPHNLDREYVIYEYGCHEGNLRYMEGALRAGRLRDAEAANRPAPASR